MHDVLDEIESIHERIGRVEVDRELYKYYSFKTKLRDVIQRALDSGEIDDAVFAKLEALANPVSFGIFASALGAYAALHGTPAAPFLLVADVGFAVSGGTETALAMQRIYLAIDIATTEKEMDAAAENFIEELSGPAADGIMGIVFWSTGRGAGWLSSRIEVDPTTFGMSGGNIRRRPSARTVHDQFVQKVRPGAKEKVFATPWSQGKGLGSRKFDDFDKDTGTAFEGNTTPWSQMTQEQLSRKLDQVGSDFALLKKNKDVKRIVWFGTEPLPTTGLGGQLREALQNAGIEYWVVKP